MKETPNTTIYYIQVRMEFDIPVYPFMYRLTQKAYEILKSKHK